MKTTVRFDIHDMTSVTGRCHIGERTTFEEAEHLARWHAARRGIRVEIGKVTQTAKHHWDEQMATTLIAREFPDFDLSTLPQIPDGFDSTAWHNESCPTWHEGDSLTSLKQGDLMLCIDYADDSRRECPGGQRFHVCMYDGGDNPEILLGSDDWAAIETAVAYARYVRHLGLGFHVDTRGPCYVNGDGSRTFTDAEAEEYDRVVYEVHGIADPYELAFTIWRTLGLIAPHEG